MSKQQQAAQRMRTILTAEGLGVEVMDVSVIHMVSADELLPCWLSGPEVCWGLRSAAGD